MKTKLSILIVDDDHRMTRTLSDIFAMEGYETVEAWSGAEALKAIEANDFDCVLTDVRMPGMNGVEFHRELKQAKPGLPVILMTAYAADEIIRSGLEEGVIGVFDKPLDMAHLLGFFKSLEKQHVIAIVDDDPTFCSTLGAVLERRGFSVNKINDPHLDMNKLASESEVILVDYKLDGTSGLDVIKDIHAQNPGMPMLLISAYKNELTAAIKAAVEINAFAYLYKPLEIPALLETLVDLKKTHLRKVIKSTQA